MVLERQQHAIGVLSSRETVEQALKELKDIGFPMSQLRSLSSCQ